MKEIEYSKDELIRRDIMSIFKSHGITVFEFLDILYELSMNDTAMLSEFEMWCELNPYDDVGAFK